MTTKFEDRLRAQLREAADDAPDFRGLHEGATPEAADSAVRRRGRWSRGRLAAAATVVVAAGIGVGWSVLPGSDPDTGGGGTSASCAMVLRFHGLTFVLSGDQVRTPRHGAKLGTGVVPGCNDMGPNHPQPSEHRAVYAIPGISPQRAILDDRGLVLVARSSGKPPGSLRDVFEPVTCSRSATISGRMTGETVGSAGLAEGTDRVTLPYTAWFRADRGSGLPLKRYSDVTIRLHVTDATSGGSDVALTRAALNGDARLTVTVRCDGSRFVATSLRLSGQD